MLAKANTNKLLVIFFIIIILLLILNFVFVITVKGDGSDQSTSSSNRSLDEEVEKLDKKLDKILNNQIKLMVGSLKAHSSLLSLLRDRGYIHRNCRSDFRKFCCWRPY